jgi:hypothetical protein
VILEILLWLLYSKYSKTNHDIVFLKENRQYFRRKLGKSQNSDHNIEQQLITGSPVCDQTPPKLWQLTKMAKNIFVLPLTEIWP